MNEKALGQIGELVVAQGEDSEIFETGEGRIGEVCNLVSRQRQILEPLLGAEASRRQRLDRISGKIG